MYLQLVSHEQSREEGCSPASPGEPTQTKLLDVGVAKRCNCHSTRRVSLLGQSSTTWTKEETAVHTHYTWKHQLVGPTRMQLTSFPGWDLSFAPEPSPVIATAHSCAWRPGDKDSLHRVSCPAAVQGEQLPGKKAGLRAEPGKACYCSSFQPYRVGRPSSSSMWGWEIQQAQQDLSLPLGEGERHAAQPARHRVSPLHGSQLVSQAADLFL